MRKKKGRGKEYRNVDGILEVVKDGLCHRCGACVGICPVNILETTPDGYPSQIGNCVECNACIEVCSGAAVDYPVIGKWLFGAGYEYGPGMGNVLSTYVGYSNDRDVRLNGASGGIVSQLLIHLLETGEIKGAIVAKGDPDEPTRAKGTVARSREEILKAAQSYYTAAPSMEALGEIAGEDGPFAVVGLPCQVHSVRMAQMRNEAWAKRISVLIALYCHLSLPRQATSETVSIVMPKTERLVTTRYRQKDQRGWPHNTVEMTFSNGNKWRAPIGPAEMVTLLGRLFPIERCLNCIDGMGEFADIAVGDPWIRGDDGGWKYSSPDGYSSMITRTEIGEKALRDAKAAGKVYLKKIPQEEIATGQRSMIEKKKLRVPLRIMVKKLLGLPVPYYPMKLPTPSITIFFKELLFAITRIASRYRFLRRAIIRFVLSKTGLYLLNIRLVHKKVRACALKAKLRAKTSASSGK